MFLDDIMAETDILVNDDPHGIHSWWFVTAHTINGGRFYSEPFYIFDDAVQYYNDIKGLVTYFGGGHVELLRISDYDYDVIAVSRI